MAEARVAGGLTVLEVTMRTPAALDAIAAMKKVPGAVVGAGTVLNPRMLKAAIDAGSEFIVSPGLTDSLGEAAVASGIPFLPGRSEEHTSELQSLMRISYAVFCLNKKHRHSHP